MKWLLALAVFFAVLWGWKKLAAFLDNLTGGKKPEVKGREEEHTQASFINKDNIEDAHFTEIEDEGNKKKQ